MSREDILRRGSVVIRVKRAGMWQRITFRVERVDTPVGKVPYLAVERFIDMPELLRVAVETGLPIRAKNGKIFPPGKSEHDFVNL